MREAKAGKSGKMHVGPCAGWRADFDPGLPWLLNQARCDDARFSPLGYQRGPNLEGPATGALAV
jgi:hypothetical protein